MFARFFTDACRLAIVSPNFPEYRNTSIRHSIAAQTFLGTGTCGRYMTRPVHAMYSRLDLQRRGCLLVCNAMRGGRATTNIVRTRCLGPTLRFDGRRVLLLSAGSAVQFTDLRQWRNDRHVSTPTPTELPEVPTILVANGVHCIAIKFFVLAVSFTP